MQQQDLDKYIQGWRKRFRKEEKYRQERKERARILAVQCSKLLAQRYHVKRVYLFGSLVEGYYHSTSDIDLAVEGLSSDLYFKALSDLWGESKGYRVDLIPLEETDFSREIRKKGELLYEKKK